MDNPHSQINEKDMRKKGSQTDVIELIYASFSQYNRTTFPLPPTKPFSELLIKARAYIFSRLWEEGMRKFGKKMIVFNVLEVFP